MVVVEVVIVPIGTVIVVVVVSGAVIVVWGHFLYMCTYIYTHTGSSMTWRVLESQRRKERTIYNIERCHLYNGVCDGPE